MTLTYAIRNADDLRPNSLPEELKAKWLHQLDGRLAEFMQVPAPDAVWPGDRELLMPAPWDNIYELYLCAQIDFSVQDIALYEADKEFFNSAYSQAMAWWRRNHLPRVKETGAIDRDVLPEN